MMRLRLASFLFALAAIPLAPLAQPSNDDCSGAIELIPSGTCSFVSGTVAGATQSIPGTVLCDGFNATPDDDVWYRFTATNPQHIIRVQGSPSFDAVIQLLTGPCNGTPVVCRDVVSAGGLEVLDATGLTVGQEYLIRVFHWAATPPATPGFQICVLAPVAPPNDDCDNAQTLVPAPTCTPVPGTTAFATETPGSGIITCDGFGANPNDDVWYRFVATATEHTITVAGSSSFDAVIQLRQGGGCIGTAIICRDLAGTGQPETLNATGLTIGQEYYVRVFHWFAAAAADPTFTICLQGPAPVCDADASTLTPNRPEVCFEDGPTLIDAAFDNPPTVPPGYEVLHVLTTDPDLTIVDVGTAPAFFVDALGTYTIHTLVYDPATLDLSGVVPGVTQAGEILSLLIQGGGDICGSLDVAGAVVEVIACATCDADAGTITADDDAVCLDNGSATISATPDGNAVVPAGYQVIYVLTQGSGLVILDASSAPEFVVLDAADYRIHTLVYDPATLDLGIVVPGTTTGFDVLQHIADNGICASLDAAGAAIAVEDCGTPCDADAGTITADEPAVCLEDGAANVSATHDGNSVVPPGYVQAYVLTQGPGLTIVAAGSEPFFVVDQAGDYTVHTLVFDPATLDLSIVEFGVTTGFEVLDYIATNGICASLDAAGAAVTVEVCGCLAEAGTMTADEPTVCFDIDLAQAEISATPNGDAVVPPGFVQIYAVTQGPELTIVDGDTDPVFTVFAPGTYTIHSFVFDPATLDISWVEPGVTTAAELLDFAAAEGACVSLDAAGAAITVQYCIDCDAEAGTLQAEASEVCLMMGEAVVSATHITPPTQPAGYEVAYALTEGPGLVIVALSGGPAFVVSEPGNYTIHTLVYDPATIDPGIIELGVTTGFDINSLLVQGGGIICGALDVAGAPVAVNDCTPNNDDCINALPLAINAIGSCPTGGLSGNNAYATMDGGVPSCDDEGSYLFDVWYTFNAGENSELTLTLDPGTMEDWAVAIYDGCGGNELACFIMPEEPIVLATDPFGDYVVQVYSNLTYGNGGQFTICLEGDVPTFICDGGLVQTSVGEFSVTVCQDTEADVIDFITTTASGEAYAFVLTDDNDVVIAVLAGGSLDFNSAPQGLYRVWGISYNGTLVGAEPGALATEITATGACADLSDNYVLVSVELCSGVAGAPAAAWNLFPNPGNGDFTLVYAGESALVSLEILDLGGRVAHAERMPMAKGQPYAFGLAGRLAPGSYVVRLIAEGQSATLPLVVR